MKLNALKKWLSGTSPELTAARLRRRLAACGFLRRYIIRLLYAAQFNAAQGMSPAPFFRGFKLKFLLLFFMSAVGGFILIAGCGSEVVVREETYGVDAPPSDRTSAGVLSGYGYATGGEHYKTVHSLGRPVAEKVQTSANGLYQVK